MTVGVIETIFGIHLYMTKPAIVIAIIERQVCRVGWGVGLLTTGKYLISTNVFINFGIQIAQIKL